jgi:hypothetical protein
MFGELRFFDVEVDVDSVLLVKSDVDVSPDRYSVSVCSCFRSLSWLFSSAFSADAVVREVNQLINKYKDIDAVPSIKLKM